MAEDRSAMNRESSMEEILSSIKRIIAEDKAIDIDRSEDQVEGQSPLESKKAKAERESESEPDTKDDDVLELTNKILGQDRTEAPSGAHGIFGDRRKAPRAQMDTGSHPEIRSETDGDGRLINDQKLDSMRQSLSALVAMEKANQPPEIEPSSGTSLEDMTRELMRPMLREWLDENLPKLVEEMVAREIQRISQK